MSGSVRLGRGVAAFMRCSFAILAGILACVPGAVMPGAATDYAHAANTPTALYPPQLQSGNIAPAGSSALLPVQSNMLAGAISGASLAARPPDLSVSEQRDDSLPDLSVSEQRDDSSLLAGMSAAMRQQLVSRGSSLLTPAGAAAALEQGRGKDFNETIADLGASLTQTAIDNSLSQVKQNLLGDRIRSINLSFSPSMAGRETIIQADAIVSLHDVGANTLLGQVGLQTRAGKEAANVGLVWRHHVLDNMLLGMNTFYDYLSDPDVSRWSVGFEFMHRVVSLSTNFYRGTGTERKGQIEYYSPDGWDVEIVGYIEQLPWLEYSGRYYKWEEDSGTGGLQGSDYKITVRPMPLLGFSVRYDSPSTGSSDVGVEATLNYSFDTPYAEQRLFGNLKFQEDAWKRSRYSRVRREYEQRVQQRGRVVGSSVVFTGNIGTVSNPPAGTEEIIITPPGVAPAAGSTSSLLRNHGGNCHVQGFTVAPDAPAPSCEYDMSTGAIEIRNFPPGNYNITINFINNSESVLDSVLVTISVAMGAISSTNGAAVAVVEGGTATYTLRLDSRPSGTVTVTLSSSDTTAVTVSPPTLMFTAAGATAWDMPRPIMLTGVSDTDTDSETVSISYVVTGYGTVSSFPAQEVEVTDITSGAAPAVTVVADSTVLMEGGSTVTLTATLSNAPATAVTLRVIRTGGTAVNSDYTATPPTLSLSSTNMSGTVRLTAVDDNINESQEELVLGLSAVDGNGAAIEVAPSELRLVVGDDDTPGVTSSSTSAISLHEGTTPSQTYTLELNTQPEPGREVTITLDSSDTQAVTVQPTSLTFNTNNWNTRRTVTVTAVQDADANNENVTISYGISGGGYDAVTLTAQSVTVTDTDTAGISSTGVASISVTERTSATYTLVLVTQPTSPVTITLTSDDTSAVTVTSTISFSTTDWNNPKTVTVTGVDDDDAVGETVTISYRVASTDTDYDGFSITSPERDCG